MRSKLLRLAVACATFVAGVSVGSLHRYVQLRLQVAAPSPTSTLEPQVKQESPAYPETLGLTPREIADFINENPQANLDRLWQRLRVTNDDDPITQFSFSHPCGLCQANIFEYNLDNDVEREVVLQIKQQYGETYLYLIFKDSRDPNPKFLGMIDVRAKYRPSEPVVLMSNDRAWLIVQGTAATGSGLGAWLDRVYEVSDSGVRQVASYLGEVSQAGSLGFPSRRFVGRPVSCEIKNERVMLKVSYTIEYSGSETPLFTKTKTVVLGGSLEYDTFFVVAGLSEITPHEFETIYNFDSMGDLEFLTYNRDELRTIATGSDSEKKTWLKEFLQTCRNSPIKRELLALLD